MKYLIVVAHPDDEVLGAGTSIYKEVTRDRYLSPPKSLNQSSANSC